MTMHKTYLDGYEAEAYADYGEAVRYTCHQCNFTCTTIDEGDRPCPNCERAWPAAEDVLCSDCRMGIAPDGSAPARWQATIAYSLWCPTEHANTEKGEACLYCEGCTHKRVRRYLNAGALPTAQILALRLYRDKDGDVLSSVQCVHTVSRGQSALPSLKEDSAHTSKVRS